MASQKESFIIEQGGHTFSVADIVAISDVGYSSVGAGYYAAYLKAGIATADSSPLAYIKILDATYAQADLVALFKAYQIEKVL